MLHDAGARVLLTESALSSRLSNDQAMVVCLDAAEPLLSMQPVDDLPGSTTADDLIYVMYTSGSTGQPKGVEIRHRSVLRLVLGARLCPFRAGRGVPATGPHFVRRLHLRDLGALLHGSRLVLAPEGVPDLFRLEEILKTQGVTTLWLTAGLFNVLVEQRVEALAGLRQLVTGGEALSVKHVRLALSRLPAETRLFNGYGPTECTTFACCYEIPRDLPEHALSVPIGRPIANTRAYVLDRCVGAIGDRHARGVVPGGRRTGAGLPQPARSDRRAVRRRIPSTRGGDCTVRGTRCAGGRTECWNSWGGSTGN